nr:retrotransposon-related protein [Tanacetum cinerariifolium]
EIKEAKMVQTQNNPDTSSGANDHIATQLVVIAAKLDAMESLKEDITDLKCQAATKQRSSGGGIRYEEVESTHSNHNRQPFHKIKFSLFSGGDPRGHRCKTRTFKVLEAEEENGEQLEIETNNLDIYPDETTGISLHAILGKPHPTTINVHGKLNSTEVLILIDGGSTHNFILDILDISLQVNDLKIILDFYPFSLGGPDLVLGIQCQDMEQHVLHLEQTLKLLHDNQFFIQLSKCCVRQTKVLFLRHVVTSEGVQVEQEKISAVQSWLIPSNVKQRITSSEQQRLLLKLMPYDFSIHHRVGKENRGADALSRMPHSGELLTLNILYCVEVADIKSGLQTDPFTSDIIQRILSDLTAEAHTTPIDGHGGFLKTIKRLNAQYFWPKMKQEEDISMDFIVGLPPSNRFNTILVVVDHLRKYAHFICLSHPFTAKSVALVFCKEIICLHGFPLSIVSNRDVIFLSNFWQELFRLSQTKLQLSTSYHPQTDGKTEVLNRCLEAYLRCFAAEQPTKWSSYLPWAEFSYNTGPYRVKRVVAPVTHELQLPSDARIHPVFYVLMLKPAHGTFDDTTINPLPVTEDWEADLQPDFVISHGWVSEAGNFVLELLISWKQKRVKTYDPDSNEQDQLNAIFEIWLDPLEWDKEKTVLVFDLGGGTFDVSLWTVSNMGAIDAKAVGVNTHLGGEDFDTMLVDHCIKEFEKNTMTT